MPSTLHSNHISLSDEALTPLPYSFVSVTGDDAEKFLQGQVSCDLSHLDADSVSYGTVNTAKGRMYGLFKIIRIDGGFLLRMESSCTDKFLKQLGKYMVFFKASMHIEAQYKAYACFSTLPGAPELPNQLVRSNDNIVLRCHSKTPMFEIWSRSIEPAIASSTAEQYFAQETLNGIPELYAETQEEFILQHLNLQHLGAVSFSKGCYTGQEIIARMKFLGKVKKQAYLLQTTQLKHSEAGSIGPGAEIIDSDNRRCGEIIRCHWSEPDNTVALGILDIAAFENSKQLSLGNARACLFQISEPDYDLS